MFTFNLRYGLWENRLCFRPLPATGFGAADIESLYGKVDEIGEQCRSTGEGDMEFFSRVVTVFREAGYARIQS